MSQPDTSPSRDSVPNWLALHAAPWFVTGLSFAVLSLRAWLVQANAGDFDSGAYYLGNALRFWAFGSVVLIAFGTVSAILPARHLLGRLGRFGWAWAIWSVFMACVPPRRQNFMSSGAADDDLIVYGPLAVIALLVSWKAARSASSLNMVPLWIGFAMLAVLASALFWIAGGSGATEVVTSSLATAGVASLGALLTFLWTRRRRH